MQNGWLPGVIGFIGILLTIFAIIGYVSDVYMRGHACIYCMRVGMCVHTRGMCVCINTCINVCIMCVCMYACVMHTHTGVCVCASERVCAYVCEEEED